MAVLLVVVVLMMVSAILRVVDIRAELATIGGADGTIIALGRGLTFYLLAAFFALFVVFLYGPMLIIFVLSFPGADGRADLSDAGRFAHWFQDLWFIQPLWRSGRARSAGRWAWA